MTHECLAMLAVASYLFYFQTGKFVSDDDVLAQAEQALKNIGAILEAAGTTEQNGNWG